VTALYDAEIGHYGTEVTQRRLRRVFRLPDVSLEWDTVRHSLGVDGRLYVEIHRIRQMAPPPPPAGLYVEIELKPVRPYKCDMTTEELQVVSDVADDVSSTYDVDVTDADGDAVAGPSDCRGAVDDDRPHLDEPR